MSPAEILKGADLINKAFPPAEGNADAPPVTWLVTPENWGIVIFESDSEAGVAEGLERWRIAVPGVYKTVKCSPAMSVMEYMPTLVEMVGKLSKA
ncbi:MAG: hypothetical protein ACFFCS_17175 [Candidatus Hodarchaeota archaeon]